MRFTIKKNAPDYTSRRKWKVFLVSVIAFFFMLLFYAGLYWFLSETMDMATLGSIIILLFFVGAFFISRSAIAAEIMFMFYFMGCQGILMMHPDLVGILKAYELKIAPEVLLLGFMVIDTVLIFVLFMMAVSFGSIREIHQSKPY